MPDNAVPGIYTLKTKVSTGYASDQKEVQFQVDDFCFSFCIGVRPEKSRRDRR